MRLFLTLLCTILISAPHAGWAQNLSDRMETLEKSIRTLERHVYREPAPAGTVFLTHDNPSNNMETRLLQLEETIRSLTGRIEELEHAQRTLERDTTYPMTTPPTNVPAVVSTPSNVPVTAKDSYDQAFALLKQKDYGGAQHAFKQFIATYPQDDLTSNAYYWLGETHYAQQQYDQAAVQFLQGYTDFPKGNKAPDSLLKLAMALGQLGKTTEACTTLYKLTSEFPKTGNAIKQRIKSEIQRFGCN